MRSWILTCAWGTAKGGRGGTQYVRKLSQIPLLEAGLKGSTLPVGMEVDSGLRTIAWGCCWSSPGALPLSPPPVPRAGGAHNMIQLRKQNTKRVIIEARENKVFVCTEEVWGYCTLTNEINAGGYLYLSWYSKENLGSACLVAD